MIRTTLQLRSGTYPIEIRFKHALPIEAQKYTQAALKIGADEYFATATLYYKDQFKRETGRKRALAKVLAVAHLDKGERTVIWDAYRDAQKQAREQARIQALKEATKVIEAQARAKDLTKQLIEQSSGFGIEAAV